MYSKQFPTESLGLFLYGLLKIVLNFVPVQNILIRRGTSPISSTRHLSSKIIEIRAPRAIMHQIARSLFHNTFKNILDISVSLEYFICTGDGRYFTSTGRNGPIWAIGFHITFSLMGSKEARFAKLITVKSIFRNWGSLRKAQARDIPAFYSAFLSQPLSSGTLGK